MLTGQFVPQTLNLDYGRKMSRLARNVRQILTAWDRALSCCKSVDVAAQQGLLRGRGLYHCILLLLNCPLSQSAVILHDEKCLPDRNRTTPKSICLHNASAGEAFPMTSVNATLTIWATKSETELIRQ